MERVVLKVQEAQKVLSNPDAEWTDHSLAIEEVAVAVEFVGQGENTKEAMHHVMLISVRGFGAQHCILCLLARLVADLSTWRRLVKDVCDHLLRIVKVVDRDFQEMANALLPQIVQTAKNASGAIRQPGAKLLNKLSELVRYDVELMRKVYVQSPQGGDNGQLQRHDESNLRRTGNDQPELGGEEDVQREEHVQPNYEDGFGFAGVDGGGKPLDNRDDSNSRNEVADAKVIDTVYSPKTDWHPQPDFRFSGGKVDFGCEDEVKEEQPTDLKLDNLPKDALDSLQDVRDQMSLLRARTLRGEDGRGLPFKGRRASGRPNEYNVLQAPTVAEEPEQQSPVNHGMQMWDQPRSTESNYLERLMHADRYGARPRESKAAPRVENSHGRFQQNELPGPRTRLSDPVGPSAHHDVQRHEAADFTREYRPVDYQDPRAEVDTTYMPAHRAMTDAPEAFSTQEPVAQYDAAGEFAIPKRGAGQDQRRVRHPENPRSPAQHVPAEAAHERFPPTKMGQKLNAVFAGARHNTVNDRAFSKEAAVEADAVKRVQDSKPRERHGGNQFHPVPSFVEEVPAPAKRDSDKQDAAETRGNVLRPLSKPPVKSSEAKSASTELGWTSSIGITFFILLAALFGATGILQAASKVRDSHEYHLALKLRIDKFEASIAESHDTVHKLEENYAIWSEYVRMLAEEDEANALAQLETIQHEVEKWQVDMKADLLEFRRSLSVDSVDAALAPLRANSTQETGQ
ncbi:hypothetical protein BBJ28_00012594 [Nothophytophthora sp. Chile5]|nr:hypothetical protein BBJ28_00012594 [Nothophytophthora sp. Chile5]